MNDLNMVVIKGPIVAVNTSDIATNIRVKVRRENIPNTAEKVRKNDVFYNQPEVAFYADTKEMASNFKNGDEVTIRAYISVTKKTSKITNTDFYDQKLIGVSIEKAVSITESEFNIENAHDTCPQYCRFVLRGEISRLTAMNGVAVINIRTNTDDHGYNNVQTSIFVGNPEEFIAKFSSGDKVTAIGTIQTLRKPTSDGKIVYRRNYILTNISKD